MNHDLTPFCFNYRFSREAEEMKMDNLLHPSNILSISPIITTIVFLLCLVVVGSVNYIASVTNDVIKSFVHPLQGKRQEENDEKSSSKDLDSAFYPSCCDDVDYYPFCPVAPL